MKKYIITFIIFVLICLPCSAEDIELGWTPNSEQNLIGYNIYYGYSSGSYTGYDITEGPSPIELHIDPCGDQEFFVDNTGDQCRYTLTGLDLISGDYWFVVAAYDDDENESGYSNEVNTVGESSSGSSSGSGCFIVSTEQIENLLIKIGAFFVVLLILALAVIGLASIADIVSKFDSDVRTIIDTSVVIIFLVIIFAELMNILFIAVAVLSFLGVLSLLIMALKVVTRIIVKC